MEAWEEAPKATDLTIKQLTNLCEQYAESKKIRAEAEAKVAEILANEKQLETSILDYMKEYALPNFKGAFGTISIRNNKSVKQPKDMDAKLEFFEYLKCEGIFEQMVSVNSRTLSSWASKEIEEREKNGVFGWVPPGLDTPTEFQSLSLRKA